MVKFANIIKFTEREELDSNLLIKIIAKIIPRI